MRRRTGWPRRWAGCTRSSGRWAGCRWRSIGRCCGICRPSWCCGPRTRTRRPGRRAAARRARRTCGSGTRWSGGAPAAGGSPTTPGRSGTQAKRLPAHGDRSAARIADRPGFADATNFSTFFRRRTGCTPIAFRDAVRGGAQRVGGGPLRPA
ncbi:helix-turn-helix domain-containing protein [Streptomyces sp. NRRL S-1448]|uniref:helix-turn-helix domain-containing protein n=1 Tax=Streptomyces sp. NRRL S-1448 TaxID=1463883 RepID=UPI002D21D301|nr:helix-turn-helix domain-containing protein [Streptomyces sp. NRRL S-1448]